MALLVNRFKTASERRKPVRDLWSAVKRTAEMVASRATSRLSQTVSGFLRVRISDILGNGVRVSGSLGGGKEKPKYFSKKDNFAPYTKPKIIVAVLQTAKMYKSHFCPISRYILRER